MNDSFAETIRIVFQPLGPFRHMVAPPPPTYLPNGWVYVGRDETRLPFSAMSYQTMEFTGPSRTFNIAEHQLRAWAALTRQAGDIGHYTVGTSSGPNMNSDYSNNSNNSNSTVTASYMSNSTEEPAYRSNRNTNTNDNAQVTPAPLESMNVPRNATNAILFTPITEGEPMVNFHGERGYGRYYSRATYNAMPTPKRNPQTRQFIQPRNVRTYRARLVGGKRSLRRKSRRGTKSRRGGRRRRYVGRVGGSWLNQLPAMIAEARTLQTLANDMDSYNAPFLVAGSTAVAILLHELLTADATSLSPAEHAEGQTLLASLQKPDDLDFKFRNRSGGGPFRDSIQDETSSAAKEELPLGRVGSRGLSLRLSRIDDTSCQQYVDLAGFRCCYPLEESPIFLPRDGALPSAFSKVEFHAPREFRRLPMHAVHIAGVDMLSVQDMLALYERYEIAANTPKLAALHYIQQVVGAHPAIREKYMGLRSA